MWILAGSFPSFMALWIRPMSGRRSPFIYGYSLLHASLALPISVLKGPAHETEIRRPFKLNQSFWSLRWCFSIFFNCLFLLWYFSVKCSFAYVKLPHLQILKMSTVPVLFWSVVSIVHPSSPLIGCGKQSDPPECTMLQCRQPSLCFSVSKSSPLTERVFRSCKKF